MKIEDVQALGTAIDREIAKAVVGQQGAVRLLTIALLSAGHVLLEGPPGTAKTLLAQSFARTLSLDFGRIQFTPDLMPGDLIGANLFNFQTSQFELTRGPVFCEILLADEINRTPPKTQAALLEAMQERAITLDGRTERLSDRFTVIATQNPIEQQGVYPLPEAQLDRFLFKVAIDYPDAESERAIVAQYGTRTGTPRPEAIGVEPVADGAAIAAAIETVSTVRLAEEVIGYVVDLVRATRDHRDLTAGASSRAAAALASAARSAAALDGRDYVIPDDVKALAPALLAHRLVLSPSAEIDGRRVNDIVAELVESVEAPR